MVEDVHSVICHAITKCLIADRRTRTRETRTGDSGRRRRSRVGAYSPADPGGDSGGWARHAHAADHRIDLPKPMVPVCGRPFLEYQVEQLADQGIERILLLLGYLPEVVHAPFRRRTDWGVQIDYRVTARTN